MEINVMRYLFVLLLFASFSFSSDYSKRGSFKRFLKTNEYMSKYMINHKNYRTFDKLYIKYAKMWNKKWANVRNSKYKGMYITPYILKALAWKESRWEPHINNKGLNKNGSIDYGLMQINNRTDRKYFRRANVRPTQADLYNPKKNIAVAMHLFDYHAGAEIRNGRNNPKDKMIYWLNSYNGKATYNPTAYGESILYIAHVLKKMNGINDYGYSYDDGQDSVEDDLEELYTNIEYARTPSKETSSARSRAKTDKDECYYRELYPYKPNLGLYCGD